MEGFEGVDVYFQVFKKDVFETGFGEFNGKCIMKSYGWGTEFSVDIGIEGAVGFGDEDGDVI